MQGTVQKFLDEKGYGWVLDSKGRKFFVHHTNIIGQRGRRTLNSGDMVTFDETETERGPVAVNVFVVTPTYQ
ncbi:MAG TPA: cold shock domain-containing protein [Bryobacteraceae bacterium]|nr:cold shock domain-containing protein [Bryobacteraceae bacterium]